MWQQSNVNLLQHPTVKSECGQGSSEAVRVVQCILQQAQCKSQAPTPLTYGVWPFEKPKPQRNYYRDLQWIRIPWLKWFHMPDQMPLKYCIISSEWSPDEYQLFRISKVPPNENNSLDQVAESSPRSSDKNLLSWGWEDSGRGNLSLDQLPNSSKACICTILEKQVSTIEGDARAFFWKKVHSSTWLLTHWLQLICIHSVSISRRVYWKAFIPEEFPDKRRKQQN